jgi:hypothetical protein
MTKRWLVVVLLLLGGVASAQPISGSGLKQVQHDTSLTGSGTSLSALGIVHCVSTGQVLQWNGSAWACAIVGGVASSTLTSGVIPVATGPAALANSSASTTTAIVGNFGGQVLHTSMTASQNNWSPTDSTTGAPITTALVLAVTTVSGNFNLTGIDATGSSDGRILIVVNSGANEILLFSDNAGSIAGNQIHTLAGVERFIPTDATFMLEFSSALGHWIEISETSGIINGLNNQGSFTTGAIIDGGSLAVTGTTLLSSALTTNGTAAASELSPASAISGNVVDYNPTGFGATTDILMMNLSANVTLQSLAAPVAGKQNLIICNPSNFELDILHESSSNLGAGVPTAADRFLVQGGTPGDGIGLVGNTTNKHVSCATFHYSPGQTRWIMDGGDADIITSLVTEAGFTNRSSSANVDTLVSAGDVTLTGGHVIANSTAPAISSGCGTSPTAPTGSDQWFVFTTGTSPGTCVINYHSTWPHGPICVVQNETTAGSPPLNSTSTTQLTITAPAASTKYNVMCGGF